jgi:GxxExxY protein
MVVEKDELTEKIIGAAIEVHRGLGPGLLESIYEDALAIELGLRSIPFRRQVEVDVHYKGHLINFGTPRLVDGIKRVSL